MKKLIIAAIAALGMTAAAAPASAGGSVHVSGYISAPAYSYNSYTPHYGSTYYAPRYVAPRYYAPAPVISYSFGNSHYKPYRAHRKARRAARRAYRRALSGHGHGYHHRRHNW